MSDFQRILFDADGETIDENASINFQTADDFYAATKSGGAIVRDVDAENAAAAKVLSQVGRSQAAAQLSDEFDAGATRHNDLTDIIEALEAAGESVPKSMRTERERLRHDLLIMQARLKAAL